MEEGERTFLGYNLLSNMKTNRNVTFLLPPEKEKTKCFTKFLAIVTFFLGLLCGVTLALYTKRIIDNGVTTHSGGITQVWPDPPPHNEVAKVARYVMHISSWGSLSTYSTHSGIEEYPFVNVFSVSDGPVSNSSGVPYFYFTPMELSVHDIMKNNKVSFTISEEQSDYCSKHKYDPEDPRCAHIIFTGKIVKLENNSEEEHFAKTALFSRHPEMPDWPTDHAWFFAKLDIVHIYVLDYFGGAKEVDISEYYKSNPFLEST